MFQLGPRRPSGTPTRLPGGPAAAARIRSDPPPAGRLAEAGFLIPWSSCVAAVPVRGVSRSGLVMATGTGLPAPEAPNRKAMVGMEYRPTGTCARPRRIEDAGETDLPRRRHVSLTANGFTGQGWQARAVSVGLPVAVIKLHPPVPRGRPSETSRLSSRWAQHSTADRRRAYKAYCCFEMETFTTILLLLLVKHVYCVQLCFSGPMDRPRAMAA